MLREMGNEITPFIVARGRRNDRCVPKGMTNFFGRELARHKTQFDERTNAILQQAVINLVDVGEIINWRAAGVFAVHPYFVLEDRMEADVFEMRDAFDLAQIAAIGVTQAEDRTA